MGDVGVDNFFEWQKNFVKLTPIVFHQGVLVIWTEHHTLGIDNQEPMYTKLRYKEETRKGRFTALHTLLDKWFRDCHKNIFRTKKCTNQSPKQYRQTDQESSWTDNMYMYVREL